MGFRDGMGWRDVDGLGQPEDKDEKRWRPEPDSMKCAWEGGRGDAENVICESAVLKGTQQRK